MKTFFEIFIPSLLLLTILLTNRSKENLANVRQSLVFCNFLISLSATVPYLNRCGFFVLSTSFLFFRCFVVIRDE